MIMCRLGDVQASLWCTGSNVYSLPMVSLLNQCWATTVDLASDCVALMQIFLKRNVGFNWRNISRNNRISCWRKL